MAKGELENRDSDELGVHRLPGVGELPEELANERGDLDSYSTRQLADGGPADMQVQARDIGQAQSVGIGSPKIDYGVRSIYDSRPVNHREFNIWVQATGSDSSPIDVGQFAQAFQVPKGFVAVLRQAKILLQPQELTSDLFDGTLEFMVNGTVRDPQDVEMGQDVGTNSLAQLAIPWRSNEPVTTFVIADELEFIGLALTVNWPTAPTDPEALAVGFYGQFLYKTGVPAQFQIANEAGHARAAATVDPRALDLASGADLLVRRRGRKDPFAYIPLVNTPK